MFRVRCWFPSVLLMCAYVTYVATPAFVNLSARNNVFHYSWLVWHQASSAGLPDGFYLMWNLLVLPVLPPLLIPVAAWVWWTLRVGAKKAGIFAVLVGTSHTLQRTSMELRTFLEDLCREHKVRAVAEEMSEEALSQHGGAASIPMEVARALAITHRLCDPNNAERAKLGILQEADMRARAFPSSLPESEVAARLADSNARREKYWLGQLRGLDLWPVLFVCGADHVATFCRLLKHEGIATHVVAEDWASNSTPHRTRAERPTSGERPQSRAGERVR